MPDTYLSVMPRPRARPDSAALAAAWGRRTPGTDAYEWAKRQVERIRTALGNGALSTLPWVDNFTEEDTTIRAAYLPLLAEPMVKAPHLTKTASVASLDCQVIPQNPDDARERQAAAAFKWVIDQVGKGSKNGRTCGAPLIAEEVLRPAMIGGWSLAELVPAPDVCRWPGPAQGKEYFADVKSKDTRRLTLKLDEYKNVVAVKDGCGQEWAGRDLDAFVVYAHWPLYCSPNGMSDFRAIYRAAWMKHTAMQLRALGLDRYTHPYLRGTAATEDQKTALKAALEDARGSGYVVLGPGDTIDAIMLGASSDDVFHNAIQDLDREILIGISWSHLPIQEGQTQGGRGDTKTQQGVAELGEWKLASDLGAVITGQVARPWYARNFADVPPATVVWGAVNEQAMLQSAQLDAALVQLGLKLSRKDRQTYYGRAAPADEGDALGGSPPGGGGPQPPGAPPGLGFSERFDAHAEAGTPDRPFVLVPPPGWEEG